MFELTQLTNVKVLDVRVLAAKDRKPDDPPGAQLLLQAMLPSNALAMFDMALPNVLYQKAQSVKGQRPIEGMESDELTNIGEHVRRMAWVYEQTGVCIEIEYGTGGPSNILLEGCRVHRVSISPNEGGGVAIQWTIDAPGISSMAWVCLPSLKATEIQMRMTGPQVVPEEQAGIEETPKSGRGGGNNVKKGPWPFGDKGDENAPNVKTPEQALAETFGVSQDQTDR
jgi:hypothetical protein